MNYYERIQRSLDYLEQNLDGDLQLTVAAQAAYMSLSNFYRIFFALVGHPVKEYVRRRRMSLAATEMGAKDISIIAVAVKYGFDSGDAFSRAFKRITGSLPSEFRRNNGSYHFERVNLMDKYFDIQDQALLEKYPDIKVLKQLEPLRVAYYCYVGQSPEDNAFAVMRDWLNRSGLNPSQQGLRIFGYNNPSPTRPDQTEYGYEVCVTIGEEYLVDDCKVKTKVLEGGLYAVTGVGREETGDMGMGIMETWQRFQQWLRDSKYVYGGHQWLEEHLGFDTGFNHIGGIDLYLPVKPRQNA